MKTLFLAWTIYIEAQTAPWTEAQNTLTEQVGGGTRLLQVSRPHVSAVHCTGKEKEVRENPERGLVEGLS